MPGGPTRSVYLRNVIRPWLLLLLRGSPAHGYDLSRRLAEHGLKADASAVYRALRLLENQGHVRSAWTTSPDGPARRVYRLTPKGRRLLLATAEEMANARAAFDAFLADYDTCDK